MGKKKKEKSEKLMVIPMMITSSLAGLGYIFLIESLGWNVIFSILLGNIVSACVMAVFLGYYFENKLQREKLNEK